MHELFVGLVLSLFCAFYAVEQNALFVPPTVSAFMRSSRIAFGNNVSFFQVANDSALLIARVTLKRQALASGDHAEILMNAGPCQGQVDVGNWIDISQFAAGVYLLRLSGPSFVETFKILKK